MNIKLRWRLREPHLLCIPDDSMICAKPFVMNRHNLPDNFLFNQHSMEYDWTNLPAEGWRESLINAVINLEIEVAADPNIPIGKAWLVRERLRKMRGEPNCSPDFYRVGGRVLYRQDQLLSWVEEQQFPRPK